MTPRPAPSTPEPAARSGPSMITKTFASPQTTNPSRSWKTLTPSAAPASLGLLVLAWPLAWAPAWAYVAAVAGAVAVLRAAFYRGERGRGWPAIAVAAAVASCAFTRAGTAVLAAEGLFILAYLLAADAPAGLTRPGRWFRLQAWLAIPGLIATGAVLAALTLHRASSAWLTVGGLAAAVVAYLMALPARAPRRSDVDVQ
jgi:hypothetical protein